MELKEGKQLPDFLLDENQVLFRKVRDDNKYFQAIFVPSELRILVLKELHDYFGHPGGNKLYNYMRTFYYWPGMKKQCTLHVRKCKECQSYDGL